jgi:putative flippase GtrA
MDRQGAADSGQLIPQLLRFLATGLLNTAFGYGLYFGFLKAGLLPELALLAATVLGVLFNFFTTGRLVFRNADNRVLGRFVLAYASVYLVNAGLLRLMISAGLGPALSQALLLPFTTLAAFALMRKWVFRPVKAWPAR